MRKVTHQMERAAVLLLFLTVFFAFNSFSQERLSVSGKVTGRDDGLPVPGVSVMVKGTKTGTSTDAAGRYTIQAPAGAVLQFRAIGFETQEIKIVGNTVNVSMAAASSALNEVVVVGAVIKQGSLTGSVASVSSEKIAATPTTDINQAIQGKVSGAFVKASPAPGGGASIRIRGNNSLQFGTNPIFVVDGVIIDGGFNSLNPDDIASIDVLKDASATAIYGSRGANGVVIVTTKKGKKGVGLVNYNTWVGWESFSREMDMMNAHDLYDLRVDAFANQYMEQHPDANRQDYINRYLTSDTSTAFAQYERDAYKQGKSYNWLDAVTRTGIEQNHTMSFSGGGDQGTYYLSMNYTDQQGIMKNSAYKRFGGRVNIDQNVKKWLKAGTNTTFSRTNQKLVDGSVFSVAVNASPFLPVDTTGYYLKWADIEDQNAYNPLRSMDIQSDQYFNRLLSSNYISINPIKDLTIRSTFSADLISQQQYRYVPTSTGQDKRNNDHGSTSHYKNEDNNWQWDNTVTYTRHFGSHEITGLAGFSMQQNNSVYDQINAYGFASDDFGYKYLGGFYSRDKTSLASDFVTTSMMSYIARADYSFGAKYFATGTVRYDGSSRFAGGHKWGAFPSLSLAWDMSRESFMSNVSWISRLKWKAGYGIAGNQNIPNYAYYTLYHPSYTNGSVSYVQDGRLGNPDVTWERQKQLDIGVDAVLLDSRLNITADYFNINNDHLLMARSLTQVSGFSNTVANVGELNNKGAELTVNYGVIRKDNLQWNLNFNISSDKNKITKLYGNTTAIYNKGGWTGVEIQRTGNYFLGESVNSIYAYKFSKIVQESDMSSLSGMDFGGRTVHPGDILPVDRDGNNIINDNDRYVVGKLDPKFYGGFGTDLIYKGFGLNVFFTYSSGLKRISGLYEGMMSSSGMTVAHQDLLNRWTPEHTDTDVPRAVYGIGRFGMGDVDLGLQDASFLRLSTFTMSYTLPHKLASPLSINNARIYLTGSNLLLFTKDKGYDPETGDDYPNSKTVTLGLNVSF